MLCSTSTCIKLDICVGVWRDVVVDGITIKYNGKGCGKCKVNIIPSGVQ